MNDEFLHRLRKEPRPEFAARLRSQLRRQSARLPPPRAPSRARTLLGLLLLGGTAFAIAAVGMRGVPPSLLELCRYVAARIAAGHADAPARQTGNRGIAEGLGWNAPGSGSSDGAAPQGGGTTHSAGPTTSARSAATFSTARSSGSTPVGAPRQIAQLRAISSWAAYPYAVTIAERVNGDVNGSGTPTAPRIEVSVRDPGLALMQICRGGADAPDVLYTFAPTGAMSSRPCPRDTSGNSGSVVAIPVGREVLALARSPLYGAPDLTLRQVFLALAKWVPDPARAAAVHENSNTSWLHIDAALGQESIQFMGPPLSSPAGRSMIELLLEAGCKSYPWIAKLASSDPKQYARICRTVRTDGVYAQISFLSPPDLLAQPNAIGIISPYGPDIHGLAANRLDGVKLTLQSVASGAYPGSRLFYLVVNRARVTPDMLIHLLNAAWSQGSAGRASDWAVITPNMPERRAAVDLALGP